MLLRKREDGKFEEYNPYAKFEIEAEEDIDKLQAIVQQLSNEFKTGKVFAVNWTWVRGYKDMPTEPGVYLALVKRFYGKVLHVTQVEFGKDGFWRCLPDEDEKYRVNTQIEAWAMLPKA